MTAVSLAVIGPPLGVADLLPSSRYWRASWVLYTAPVDHARLVVGAGLVTTVVFALPSALLDRGIPVVGIRQLVACRLYTRWRLLCWRIWPFS